MGMSHDELAVDLAASLRTDKRMTWCDIQLGPSGSVRPDVYAIYKSYVNPCPTAYECKVSVSDFRADITSGKWQSYLKYAGAVYFACEGDLIKKSEVPAHCGLTVLRNGMWRAAKKATLSPVVIPQEGLIKLLIDGVEREGPRMRCRQFNGYAEQARMQKKFGDTVGLLLKDRLEVERQISNAKYQAEQIIEDAKIRAEKIRTEAADIIAPMRVELCQILGLPSDASQYKLGSEVRRIRRELEEHPAHTKLKTITSSLRWALQQHGYKEPTEQVELED